jgi:hypothetical protein
MRLTDRIGQKGVIRSHELIDHQLLGRRPEHTGGGKNQRNPDY